MVQNPIFEAEWVWIEKMQKKINLKSLSTNLGNHLKGICMQNFKKIGHLVLELRVSPDWKTKSLKKRVLNCYCKNILIYVYDEFYRNSHLKKTQFVAKGVLMSTTAGNIFFVEYWLLEHIPCANEVKKLKFLILLTEWVYFRQKQFRSFSHSG